MKKLNLILLSLSILLISYKTAEANDLVPGEIRQAIKFSVLSIVKGSISLEKDASSSTVTTSSTGSVGSVGGPGGSPGSVAAPALSNSIFGTKAKKGKIKTKFKIAGQFGPNSIAFVERGIASTERRGGKVSLNDSRLTQTKNQKFTLNSVSTFNISFGAPCIGVITDNTADINNSTISATTSCTIPFTTSKVKAQRKGNKIKIKGKLKNDAEKASGRFSFTLKGK